MTRGELWWADFGVPFGSEPGYKRPVLIVQNDFFNNSKINTTIVIPSVQPICPHAGALAPTTLPPMPHTKKGPPKWAAFLGTVTQIVTVAA